GPWQASGRIRGSCRILGSAGSRTPRRSSGSSSMGEAAEAALGGSDDGWYLAPSDLDAAIGARAGGGRVLAGGTDLVATMNIRGERPERVVWIGGLGLDGVHTDGDVLRIGAGTTLASIATDPLVRENATALAAAATKVAGPAVRNLATV